VAGLAAVAKIGEYPLLENSGSVHVARYWAGQTMTASKSMIPKSGHRFSERIMLQQKDRAE
jgi:hypothetical protein